MLLIKDMGMYIPARYMLLKDQGELKFSNVALKVIHALVHTLGSISFVGDGIAFTGDTLFARGIDMRFSRELWQ